MNWWINTEAIVQVNSSKYIHIDLYHSFCLGLCVILTSRMGLISRQPNACLASHEQTPETIIVGFNVWKAKYSKQ